MPRNVYRTADHRWVAVSTSAESVAQRVLDLIGVQGDPRFVDFTARAEHRDELDARLAAWIADRSLVDVLAAFEAAQAAAAPVYDMADIAADPHYRARDAIVDVDGVPMQGLVARLSATPGAIRWPGRPLGADTESVLADLADDA